MIRLIPESELGEVVGAISAAYYARERETDQIPPQFRVLEGFYDRGLAVQYPPDKIYLINTMRIIKNLMELYAKCLVSFQSFKGEYTPERALEIASESGISIDFGNHVVAIGEWAD